MRAHTLFLSLLLLSFPALAFSENATAESSPPPVPQAGGLLAVKAVLVDGTPAVGMPLVITATKEGSITTYRLITGREGNVLLTLEDGEYLLSCVLDDMATGGADFAATSSLAVPGAQNLTLVFYPAGSVAVAALEGGKPVPGAAVHASCASDWFDYGKMDGANPQAGEAGDFLFRALPAGTCVVSASTQASAGSAQVNVEQGTLSFVQVELKPKALPLSGIALAIALIVVAGVLIYFFVVRKPAHSEEKGGQKGARQKKAREVQPKVRHEAPSSFDVNGEKARAVLSTLSEREAEIARFLISAGGRAKRSTLQHKLLIPKTSLLRNLRSLERKRIVKLTPFGRNLVAEINKGLFE